MEVFEWGDGVQDVDVLVVECADEDAVDSDSITTTITRCIPSLHLPSHPVPPVFEFLSVLWFAIVAPDEVAAEFSSFERVWFCDGVDVAWRACRDCLGIGVSARSSA